MRPQIFLHIGMQKTGTTFLQYLFDKFRKQLLQTDRLLFPETGFRLKEGVRPKPDNLSGHSEFVRKSSREAIIRKLAAEISACSPQRVFISSEKLGNTKSEVARALVEDLERIGSVSIILVLRRQDKWIDSYYRQKVADDHKGETRDFQTYLREEGPNLLDYGVRYQPWRQAPFSGRFLVASYDDLADQDRLLSWICESLRLSHSANLLHLEQVPTNPSLSRLDAEITRLVNLVPDLEPTKRTDLLRHIYGLGTLPDAPFISDDLYEELRTCYEPKNKQLADEWAIDPALELINWRRTMEQSDWAANLGTTSAKLTAVSNGLQDICHSARREQRPLDILRARFAQIRTSRFLNGLTKAR